MHRNPNALALVSDFGIGMHARDSSTFYLLLSMPSAFYRDFSFFFISNQSFRLVLSMFDTALGGNTSTNLGEYLEGSLGHATMLYSNALSIA